MRATLCSTIGMVVLSLSTNVFAGDTGATTKKVVPCEHPAIVQSIVKSNYKTLTVRFKNGEVRNFDAVAFTAKAGDVVCLK